MGDSKLLWFYSTNACSATPFPSRAGSSSTGIAAWFQVVFGAIPGTLHQAELRAKLTVKRFCVITHHFEPAAFRRALWTKRANNDVAAWLDARMTWRT